MNAGSAIVAVQPFEAGTAINLGSTTNAAANTLELSDAELDTIFAGSLIIGNALTGPITVSASINPANVTGGLSLRSGADVVVDAGVTIASPFNVEMIAGDNFSLGAGTTLQAGGGITIVLDTDSDAGTGGTADLRNGTVSVAPGGSIRLIGNADAAIFFGSAANEQFFGNGGNDTLDGRGGIDRLAGGAGNDTYVLDQLANIIVESAGQGTDTVRAGFTFALSSTLENLTAANVVIGNAGANTLRGLSGNDRLCGVNVNDIMTGGMGCDILSGGGGRDTFDFNAAAESSRGSARRDVVDFRRGDRDRIDLATIDADTDGTAGKQAFKFIGSAGFDGVDGELRFSGGVLQGDTNGDKIADIEIRVLGVSSMFPSDFFL